MDKRTATLTLTEKLANLGYINLVADPAVKSYLLNNAKSVILALKKGRIRIVPLGELYYSHFEKTPVSRGYLPSELRDFPEANYFFAEGGKLSEYGPYLKNPFVTPVALIGGIEERVLRETFYKDVPDEIVKAFEVLRIPNFIDAYSVYSSLKEGEVLPFSFGIYRPFEKDDKIELGDIIQGSSSKRYYLVDEINSAGINGYRFKDGALKTPAEGKKDDERYGHCEYSMVIPVKKRLSDVNFFDFVFSLPYEEQNIEVNKIILKNLSDVDSCRILLKEYSKDKLFKDYFAVLDEKCQKEVVKGIKALPGHNKFLDSWLFKEGFDIDIDYLKLYKEDAQRFIGYFKAKPEDVKKLIISDLLGYEHINPEVIEFLEKEYSHLLRDTAFNEK